MKRARPEEPVPLALKLVGASLSSLVRGVEPPLDFTGKFCPHIKMGSVPTRAHDHRSIQ
jgi:hypothetical protein